MASAGVIYSHILQRRNAPASSSTLPDIFNSKGFYLSQLGLFIDALRSIGPQDAHYERCQKALRIFTRVHEVHAGAPSITITNPEHSSPMNATTPQHPPNPHSQASTHFTDSNKLQLPSFDSGPPTGGSDSTDYFTEHGLTQNLGDFGGLPWLQNVWINFGGDQLTSAEEGGLIQSSWIGGSFME
jgi:hypothetical protein